MNKTTKDLMESGAFAREHAPLVEAGCADACETDLRAVAASDQLVFAEPRVAASYVHPIDIQGAFKLLRRCRAFMFYKSAKECEAILIQVRFFQQLVGLELAHLSLAVVEATKQGLVLPPQLSKLAVQLAELSDSLECLDEMAAAAANAAVKPTPEARSHGANEQH